MKTVSLLLLASTFAFTSLARAQSTNASPRSDTVVLDATGVENLRIKTALVEETDFEETAFALGRIEAQPEKMAAVSSRIVGRVVALHAFPGDRVELGSEIVKVESRQPGNPAPVIALKAPLSGVITHLDVRLGDPVETEKSLLEITDLSEVYAVARVPETIVGRLKPGTVARIVVPAVSEVKFEGQLLRFGTAADPTSGTIDTIFKLENAGLQLRPGMRAEFSVVLERRAKVLSVPRSALQGEPANRFVYVKDFDLPNAFIKAPVVTGQSNEQFVEIIRGVLPADEVVTQGAYSLSFVGGGGVSLKEALDAAHGHEHAADGSEITAEQKKTSAPPAAGHHDHEHDDDHQSPFWMIVSGVLFVLLLVVSVRKKSGMAKNL